MKTYKDSLFFQNCWDAFFPNTTIPEPNDMYIKAIIIAGRHLLRKCKIENVSYISINIDVYKNKLMNAQVKLHNFKFNVIALHDKLQEIGGNRKHMNQLRYLIDAISETMEELHKTTSKEKRLLQFLRIPFSIERQPIKEMEVIMLPRFSIKFQIVYN